MKKKMCSSALGISWITLFDMLFAEKCCDSSPLSAEPPKSWLQPWESWFCGLFPVGFPLQMVQKTDELHKLTHMPRCLQVGQWRKKNNAEGKSRYLEKSVRWSSFLSLQWLCTWGDAETSVLRQEWICQIIFYFGLGGWTSSNCPQLDSNWVSWAMGVHRFFFILWASKRRLILTVIPIFSFTVSPVVRTLTVPPWSSLGPFAVEAVSNSGSLGALHQCNHVVTPKQHSLFTRP